MLCYAILYCTVLYCTVLYYTILYCTVLNCTALYCTVLYSRPGRLVAAGGDGDARVAEALVGAQRVPDVL